MVAFNKIVTYQLGGLKTSEQQHNTISYIDTHCAHRILQMRIVIISPASTW